MSELRLLKAVRNALRHRAIHRISKQTHTGFVWTAKSQCDLCEGQWLTADHWERHKPGCLAVDPAKLAPVDSPAHVAALVDVLKKKPC